MIDPATQRWFHGRIARVAAEESLKQTNMGNGTFLLRESSANVGCYVLSVCHNGKIIHYAISKHANGKVAIMDGPEFPGPVELVRHHQHRLDGLLTLLTFGHNRPAEMKTEAYKGVGHEDLDTAIRVLLRSEGIESEEAVSRFRIDFQEIVGSILHKRQPWFHGIIPRDEADRRLKSRQSGGDGTFLIRERGGNKKSKSYVLGLWFTGRPYHYLFEPNAENRLSIKSGRAFDNLMALVNFYYQKAEGLLCCLEKPCDVADFEFRPRTTSHKNMLLQPDIQEELRKAMEASNMNLHIYRSLPAANSQASATPGRPGRGPSASASASNNPVLYDKIYSNVASTDQEALTNPSRPRARTLTLDRSLLKLGQELGHGNFGAVVRGTYTMPGTRKVIDVAVKTLKEEDIPGSCEDITKEAEIMMNLNHPNIVRLIGMTPSPEMMLVMELAPLGPLNKFLKSHKDITVLKVMKMIHQVAKGMQYLEGVHFVHRDLAARNVLIVDIDHVKISDFGMSRAMGAGNEYYRAERVGKWPLKWYAPEAVSYRKFTSKGDVWSFGVTMWEALSYGQKPYKGLNGHQVHELIEREERLKQPEKCADVVYKIMRKCWIHNPEGRPSFTEIEAELSSIIDQYTSRR